MEEYFITLPVTTLQAQTLNHGKLFAATNEVKLDNFPRHT